LFKTGTSADKTRSARCFDISHVSVPDRNARDEKGGSNS